MFAFGVTYKNPAHTISPENCMNNQSNDFDRQVALEIYHVTALPISF